MSADRPPPPTPTTSNPPVDGGPWAFDLDGTLVDALSATRLRPLAVELLERLRALGETVIIWSAGGGEYAERVAHRLTIAHLVDGFYDKIRGPDGTWRLDLLPEPHRPAICVDDEPGGLPAAVRAIPVSPFLGGNPGDRGLAKVFGILDPREWSASD